ncbi:helix-turn-helix domain-containing protein [Limnoglobus roseus]|uniref:helix-turn-helix domain-containing protein n=1 Tax=Limnoglobus roseus TaxID=2598579 RepID=UPI00143CCB94|nr:helix-turn-helix transcriptional regulator [Limnoglobus roseus]
MKQLRAAKGLTAESLADKCGVSVKTVSNAERGKEVLIDNVARLADVLGVKAAELIFQPERNPIARPLQLSIHINLPDRASAETGLIGNFIKLLEMMVQSEEMANLISVTKGSIIITLEMGEADVAKLVVIFPRFRDHASQYVQLLPDHVALMEMVNAVTELRIMANQLPREVPPEVPTPVPVAMPPEAPVEPASEPDQAADIDDDLYGIRWGDAEHEYKAAEKLPSPERERRIAAIDKAVKETEERDRQKPKS